GHVRSAVRRAVAGVVHGRAAGAVAEGNAGPAGSDKNAAVVPVMRAFPGAKAMMTDNEDSGLRIRSCRVEDEDAILELWRQANATPSVTDTAGDLRRAVASGPANVLVAEVDERMVGSIIGTFDGWRGNIYRMAVHPDYRRRGIARALVAEVEK